MIGGLNQTFPRDPGEAIKYLLEQPEPLRPIFQAMQKLRQLGDGAAEGSVERAITRRNELLLGLLISNPLRSKNFVHLTYRPDNTGNVYFTSLGSAANAEDGAKLSSEWRLRLPRAAFKNRSASKQAVRQYDVGIAPWLSNLLTEYVEVHRPLLCGDKHIDNLFVTRNGLPLFGISQFLVKLTRRLIPGSDGFGPHAFRHLVATAWLRQNPGDYYMVAELLNDTLDVVLANYAHLKTGHALNRHSEQISHLLPEYLKLHNIENS
jgi:integrase